MESSDAHYGAVPIGAGHYESFYLRAGHPTRPLAVWIRYTVLKRPGAPPRGSLWFTLFDRSAAAPRASKVTHAPGDLSTGARGYIRIGESRFEPGRVAGSAGGASWDLGFSDEELPFHHLPRSWMYRTPIPRTKVLSPHPLARFDGRVAIDGEEILLSDWRGMVGHNWGSEHAERWIWLHGAGFDGHPEAWFDAAIGKIRVGPLTSPWIANGALSLGGARLRLGGMRPARVRASPERCEFSLRGVDVRLRGAAVSPRKDLVAWIYSDPSGGTHQALNCSIAGLELTLERPHREALVLRTAAGAVYELGMSEPDHGVPLQPFGDP